MKKDFDVKNLNLSVNNYHEEEYGKNKIIIGNTGTSELKHINTWKYRLNGEYKKTAPYTITRDGIIYKHYNPKYYSDFTTQDTHNKESIPIVLENEGWLNKKFRNKEYVNWIGDTYNIDHGIINIKWRGKKYWAGYSDKQIESLIKLCNELCTEFNIPLKALEHNTKNNLTNFKGITYRSNYNTIYTDISPAFNIKEFKNNL